jgi:hypothetical protein
MISMLYCRTRTFDSVSLWVKILCWIKDYAMNIAYYMSCATVFLGYLRCVWRNIMFLLISAINFYYVINKLIILVPNSH